MGLRYADIFATLIINLIHTACAEHILSCNVTILEPCQANQRCNASSHVCECDEGFSMVGEECVPQKTDSSSSHGATAAVVTIFTLALLGCGLYLVVRKYNLVDYVRRRINYRLNNDVLYEDVMIGQDDPPLSP